MANPANNNTAKELAQNVISEFWERNSGSNFIHKLCAPDLVTFNNDNSLTIKELEERVQHNRKFYSHRTFKIYDAMTIDKQIVTRYALKGIDNITAEPITKEFVEIMILEKNLLKNTWLMGDLSYSSKYKNLTENRHSQLLTNKKNQGQRLCPPSN